MTLTGKYIVVTHPRGVEYNSNEETGAIKYRGKPCNVCFFLLTKEARSR